MTDKQQSDKVILMSGGIAVRLPSPELLHSFQELEELAMGGLIRLLVIALIIWLIVLAVRRFLLPPALPRRERQEKAQEGVLLVEDPQCGRFVPERDAVSVSVRGRTWHFCSHECRDLYVAALKSPVGKKNRD